MAHSIYAGQGIHEQTCGLERRENIARKMEGLRFLRRSMSVNRPREAAVSREVIRWAVTGFAGSLPEVWGGWRKLNAEP
jgi:hypothetical protein